MDTGAALLAGFKVQSASGGMEEPCHQRPTLKLSGDWEPHLLFAPSLFNIFWACEEFPHVPAAPAVPAAADPGKTLSAQRLQLSISSSEADPVLRKCHNSYTSWTSKRRFKNGGKMSERWKPTCRAF